MRRRKILQGTWAVPLVIAVDLPAHAQTSCLAGKWRFDITLTEETDNSPWLPHGTMVPIDPPITTTRELVLTQDDISDDSFRRVIYLMPPQTSCAADCIWITYEIIEKSCSWMYGEIAEHNVDSLNTMTGYWEAKPI